MELRKYHGLGNDYFVLTPAELGGRELSAGLIRRICDRHFGAGSDGILLGPIERGTEDFARLAAQSGVAVPDDCRLGLRILNPDGSEAEKSGNGLRIFTQYLHDGGLIGEEPVRLLTLGGVVTVQVLEPRRRLRVEVGEASFRSSRLPMTGAEREVVAERLEAGGHAYTVTCVSVGNPHCVVTGHAIELEIWERGAGYTLASGTSASASAAAAVRLGLCASPVTVRMPGGSLRVEIDAQWRITLTGPAEPICRILWPDGQE